MNSNKHVNKLSFLKTEEEKIQIIIKYVRKMLQRRKTKDFEPLITDQEFKLDNNVYKIIASDKQKYAVRIIFQKITNIGQKSLLNNFIEELHDYNKIIIASGFSPKIIENLKKLKIQSFTENIFLSDFLKNKDQPIFELINKDEANTIMNNYHIDIKTASIMLSKDPVALYFKLKKGNLVRIIRTSPITGQNVSYRIIN